MRHTWLKVRKRAQLIWESADSEWRQIGIWKAWKENFGRLVWRCLPADCCCWWVELFGTAMSSLMNESCRQTTHWIKPCGWWIWPKSLCCLPLSLSPCLCLCPTPTHKSSSSAIKASRGQRELVFFPAFTILWATAIYFPCLIPLPVSPSLCLPFPVSLLQSILLTVTVMA